MIPSLAPGQVWRADLEPAEGHEQGGRRPVLVVSSQFHIDLTRETVVTVLPFTSRERRTWLHRPFLDVPPVSGWVITEQIRTISTDRLLHSEPLATLTESEIELVQPILRRMLAI